MKKIEAATLAEAKEQAAKHFNCEITNIYYEVVQEPKKGILGLFKKSAIIVASKATVEHVDEILDFCDTTEEEVEHESVEYNELARKIEADILNLLNVSCFDIDRVEVDVIDETALIFIDGEDAALLIGKEGYRYNAFCYMLFNWLHTKYELQIKLEIAEFLTTQQDMIRSYLEPVIATVQKDGRAKTKFLDGILVQIALEQLREEFPDKYVGVKTVKNGQKFVVVNDFNNNNA